jgi:hypothetical protein
VALAALGVSVAFAQEPSGESGEDGKTRQLWNESFTQSRPQAAQPAVPPPKPDAASPKPAAPTPKPATSRPKPASRPGKPIRSDSFVGVTVWRLQPASPADASRGVTVDSSPDEKWLPHRVEVGAGVAEGTRVRLSVEASRRGYLYVIDREQYADGTLGEPTLIFPTLRIRDGNNEVRSGRVVELPDLGDRPPFFTMKRSRGDHVGEVLTVLITPSPISGLQIGRAPIVLSKEQVQEWEKKWSAPTKRLELTGGAGRPYTKAEREAAESQTRLLTQEDPLPQTMYQVASKPEDALLVAVPLKIK